MEVRLSKIMDMLEKKAMVLRKGAWRCQRMAWHGSTLIRFRFNTSIANWYSCNSLFILLKAAKKFLSCRVGLWWLSMFAYGRFYQISTQTTLQLLNIKIIFTYLTRKVKHSYKSLPHIKGTKTNVGRELTCNVLRSLSQCTFIPTCNRPCH